MISSRPILTASLLLVLWIGGAAHPATVPIDEGPHSVVVLVSGGAGAYKQVEAGLREALNANASGARIESIALEDDIGQQAARKALSSRASLVIAIGSAAARFANENGPKSPLLYAMVLDPGSIGLPSTGETPSGKVTGVTMEVSVDTQFKLLREIIPDARRIGVLYDPAVSGEAVRSAAAVAVARGLKLVAQPVRMEGDVLGAAAVLAPAVDALWAIADPTVVTPANARALILFSLRNRKPLFAMSEGFVRTGALAALSADPKGVGRRTGELAALILDGVPMKTLKPEPPPRLSLFVNRATADHLGMDLPIAVVIRATTVYPQP